MSPQLISLMLGTDHAVPVEPNGGSATVTVGTTGGTVFYADSPQVSATNNQGSIAPGGSQSFTGNTWLRGSASADVKVTTTSVYDQWAQVSLPISAAGFTPWAQGVAFALNQTTAFNGVLYYCSTPHTAGGSFDPSKFTATGAQGELGYTSITASFTTPSPGVEADVTGLAVTATLTARPVTVETWTPQFAYSGTPSGSSFAIMKIYDVTASNTEIARAIIGGPGPTGNLANPARPMARVQPGAGSRTYKVAILPAGGLTASVTCAATFPAWIRVTEF